MDHLNNVFPDLNEEQDAPSASKTTISAVSDMTQDTPSRTSTAPIDIWAAPVSQKPPAPMPIGKPEILFAPVSIALGFMLVECIFFHKETLFMTLSVLAALIAGKLYMKANGFTFQKSHNMLFTVLIVFSLAYSYTANTFLCGLVTLFEAGGFCFLSYLVSSDTTLSDFCLPSALKQAVLQFPFRNQSVMSRSINEGLNHTSATKNVKYIILGLFITIPLTLIVAGLLMSADDGVAEILTSFMRHLLPNLLRFSWRLVLALILACMIFGMLYTCITGRGITRAGDEDCARRLSRLRIAPGILLCAGVLPICLLYCIFIYSQAGYLLAAFAHRLPEGFSYAQYARQGFFELCILSLINLCVIVALQLLAKDDDRTALPMRICTLALCCFTLFILATAFRKMVLYIEHFGLTSLRFYTSWFMVLLTVLFVLLIIQGFKRTFPIFKNSLIAFVIWFFLLVFSRPDALIAAYNYEMYQNHSLSQMDYSMISDLSADAWSVLGAKEDIPYTYRLEAATDLRGDNDTFFNLSALLADHALHSAKDLKNHD